MIIPAKQSNDQHLLLHEYYPYNCCLCRLELELRTAQQKIQELEKENQELCDAINKAYEIGVGSGHIRTIEKENK